MSSDASFKFSKGSQDKRFRRREGDWSQEGSNNTLIVLETDRAKPNGGPAGTADGLGTFQESVKLQDNERVGAIHIVAGRISESGDTDLVGDDSYLYMSSLTNPDVNIAIEKIGGETDWEPAKKVPALIAKSNNIRIVYRNTGDIRILSDGAKSFLVMNDKFIDWSVEENFWLNVGGTKMEIKDEANSNKIRIGPLVPGLKDLVDSLHSALSRATVVSYTGNMGAPVPNNGDLKINLLQALDEWRSSWLEMPYMKTK
jgi:hypothetical protein